MNIHKSRLYYMFFANSKEVLFTLVTDLRRLQNFSEKLHLENLTELLNALIKRIESDSFSIAVVGEFKRGKSTFINALLGQEILPSDVLPTTATLNRVIFGEEPAVKIVFKDGEEREIDPERLVSFVTKLTPECEAVAATVKEAVIYYPLYFCRNHHVEIIDTPGLSDDENMTAVTFAVLNKVEVAIMVTSALAPFAESEGKFLTENLLAANLGRIIFVVTGIDHLKRQQEVDKVIKLVEKRIKEYVRNWAEQFEKDGEEYDLYMKKVGQIKVFGLSAYQALLAKQKKDTKLLAESRFRDFESGLEKVFKEERSTIIFQLLVNGAIASSTKIIKAIDRQVNSLTSQQDKLTNHCEVIGDAIATLRQIVKKEMSRLNAVNGNIKYQVIWLRDGLENRLKQAAEQVIESTEVNYSNGIELVIQEFANCVYNALQTENKKMGEKIQSAIERESIEAIKRMRYLVESAKEVMHNIEIKLESWQESTFDQSSVIVMVESLDRAFDRFNPKQHIDLSNLSTWNAQIFLLADNPSGLYTAVGGVAGSFFGPWGIAVGAAVGAKIGDAQRARKFKEVYKPKVSAEIEKQVKLHKLTQLVNESVDEVCRNLDNLKNQVEQEIITWLDNTQNTVAQLHSKQQALIENERKTLQEMQNETQTILNNARNMLEQIAQINQAEKDANSSTKLCENCNYKNLQSVNFCIKCGHRLS